jgi:hypothetical protein
VDSSVRAFVGHLMDSIAFIELHDSILTGLDYAVGGVCQIQFEHLAIYRPIAPDRFEVWSTQATIRLFGTKSVRIQGELDHECVYVFEGTFRDEDGNEIRDLSPIEMERSRSLAIRMDRSGTSVEIEMASATLVVGDTLK